MTEAILPEKESGPAVRNMSSIRDVAAEEENSFNTPRGIRAEGNEPVFILEKISVIPEARRMETAIIRPIKDGSIPKTVFSPERAPSAKEP